MSSRLSSPPPAHLSGLPWTLAEVMQAEALEVALPWVPLGWWLTSMTTLQVAKLQAATLRVSQLHLCSPPPAS